MKRILSLFLVFCMLFSSLPTFASNNFLQDDNNINIDEEEMYIELLKTSYENMSPQAKECYLQALALDPDAYAYHVEFIDPTVQLRSMPQYDTMINGYSVSNVVRSSTSIIDMYTITRELQLLNLPQAVYNSLIAAAASMSAPYLDFGSITGEALLAIVGLSTMAVIAWNWDTVEPKWSSIVAAFKSAYTGPNSSDIAKALGKLYGLDISRFDTYYAVFPKLPKAHTDHAEEFRNLNGGRKPTMNEYFLMARKFRDSTGAYIMTGTYINDASRIVKFHKMTMEYMVYNKYTGAIITYYRPKYSSFINKPVGEWMKKALEYFNTHIR